MSQNSNHILGEALRHAKHGPALKHPKNPIIAFCAGVLCGPFGTGLYLGTWFDFWAPFAVLMVVSLGTAGIAAPVAWLFAGAWGAIRASATHQPAIVVIDQKQLPQRKEVVNGRVTGLDCDRGQCDYVREANPQHEGA